jgi:hypothetical protein
MMSNPQFTIDDDDDELAEVVRSHLYIEHQLERYIRACLPNPDELGDRLTYTELVRLALACGLRRDLKSPLNTLGALRNKFSHNLSTTITDKEMAAFDVAFRGFIYDPPRKADFYDLTDLEKNRLADYLLAIWRALEAETKDALVRLHALEKKEAAS